MIPLGRRLTLLVALVTGLTACAPAPSPDVPAGVAASATLSMAPGERRYIIDDSASALLVYTYRGGKLARFGHNHVLNAKQLTGEIALAPDIAGSRFLLEVPLASIEVDNPALRAAAGSEFDSKPSPEDVAATRNNMLGAEGLDATLAPAATISGVVGALEGTRATLELNVTVRQASHRQSVAVQVQASAGSLRISGTTSLKHSDFGIAPFSVMLGALTVKDKVDVRFELVARPAT